MLLELIFPPKCPYCRKGIRYDMTECLACRAGYPLDPRIEITPKGDICIAPFTYENQFARALKDYKFSGRTFNSKSFAAAIVSAIRKTYHKDMDFDIVTCVPMTKSRLRKRGFNQAAIIGKRVALLSDKPYSELLIRTVDSEHQHYLGREERIKHNKKYYSCISPENVKGKKILLIDDIMTSGATLSSCSEVLRDNGADRVLCAVTAIVIK